MSGIQDGLPNNDTLLTPSPGWISADPVIPKMGERFYVRDGGMGSDNFAYVGSRTAGLAAASFR